MFFTSTAFADIQFRYENEWIVKIALSNFGEYEQPLILMLMNGDETNAEMFFMKDMEHEVVINLSDGSYTYLLSDMDDEVIESGNVDLVFPVDILMDSITSTSVNFQLETEESVFLECYIYDEMEKVQYKRFLLENSRVIEFEDLEPGMNYTFEFKVGDASRELSVVTPLINIVENMPVTGTFTRLPESKFVYDFTPAITRVNDGLIEWYRGMAVSGGISDEDQYLIIDLLEDKDLKLINLHWNANYYPLQYQVMYSSDGENWNFINRFTNQFTNYIASDFSPVILDSIKTNLNTRYIGLYIEEDTQINKKVLYRNYVQLMEFEAYE